MIAAECFGALTLPGGGQQKHQEALPNRARQQEGEPLLRFQKGWTHVTQSLPEREMHAESLQQVKHAVAAAAGVCMPCVLQLLSCFQLFPLAARQLSFYISILLYSEFRLARNAAQLHTHVCAMAEYSAASPCRRTDPSATGGGFRFVTFRGSATNARQRDHGFKQTKTITLVLTCCGLLYLRWLAALVVKEETRWMAPKKKKKNGGGGSYIITGTHHSQQRAP